MQKINFDLPTIDLKQIKKLHPISETDEKLILGITHNPIEGRGVLRGTRPKDSGEASWLWRNMMVFASPEEKFHNITHSLDEYLADCMDKDQTTQQLTELLHKIMSTIPPESLPGLRNWKAAMGV